MPTTQLSSVTSQWQALDEYLAKKAYVAVFGYQTFPKFASDRINYGALATEPDLRLGLDLVPAEVIAQRRAGAVVGCPGLPRTRPYMATSAERLGTGLEFSDEFSGFGGEGDEELPPGIGPWKLAWRRLRRNKVALFFGGLFLLIVLLCLLAPVYSQRQSPTRAPGAENITGTIKVGGKASRHRQPDRHPDRPDLAQPVLPRR